MIKRYFRILKTVFISTFILSIVFLACQNNTNKDNTKENFKSLAKDKEYSSDLEYIKEEEIIKTDVIALNKKTNIKVRDFIVSINQIDNSRFPEVTLIISVTDKDGNPLVVNPDFFRIEENGFLIPKENIIQIVQKKELVKNKILTPLNIILAIDKSRSMTQGSKEESKQAMHFAKQAAIEFIKQSQENDIVRVIAFDGDLHLLGSNDSAITQIENLKAKGSTALYAVLLNSVKELQLGGGIKAVILLTDGKNDTRGTINKSIKSITFNDGIYAANQLAIPVFTIAFGNKSDKDTLKAIARRTHGTFFSTGNKEEINTLYHKIRDIINTQYLITYKSNSLEEVTDVQVQIGYKKDKRTFTTPSYVINREKKLREEINIVKNKEKELVSLQAEIEKRLKESIDKEKEMLNKQAKLQRDILDIEKRTKAIKDKENKLKEYENTLNRMKLKLGKLEKEIESREQSIASQNTYLDREKEKLNQIKKAQGIREKSLSNKDAKLQTTEEQVNKKIEELEKSKAQISEKEIQIENKNKELSRLIKKNNNMQSVIEKKQAQLKQEAAAIRRLKTSLDAILKDVKYKYKKALEDVSKNKEDLDKLKP